MSYVARAFIAVGLAALAFLLWQVKQVLLILFGGVIFATVLGALAKRIARWTRLGHRGAVASSVLLVTLGTAALLWLAGDAVFAQLDELREQLPRAADAVRGWLATQPLGPRILDFWQDAAGAGLPMHRLAGWAGWTINALGTFLLIVLLGVFIAAEPGAYRRGAARLFAPAVRPSVLHALEACRDALGGWLKGQGVSMLFVGTTTGLGLALLDVPLALILGVLSALLGFVPYFGAILAGLLSVLIAFMQGPQTALYVALLQLAIQQVEGNILMPLVQRWAVRLPPVLGLVSVVVFGGLFGLEGVLFATPLMVVLMVLVRTLYIEDFLEGGRHGEEARHPGAPAPEAPAPQARA